MYIMYQYKSFYALIEEDFVEKFSNNKITALPNVSTLL